MEYTEECCLNPGVYTLKCKNEEDDGWYGGFLEIQGKHYCKDFLDGDEKSVQVTIVSGKYGFRKFWMSGSIKCFKQIL